MTAARTPTTARPGTLVGASVARRQDPRLLTGGGGYLDDLELPGMLHAAVVRSPAAHARLSEYDGGPAAQVPGVHLVIGPDDTRHCNPIPCVWVMPGQRRTSYPVLTRDVRYAGEPLGLVVAASRAIAEDGADAVVLDFENRPPIVDLHTAMRDDVLLFEDWGTNVAVDMEVGDDRELVAEALSRAEHRVSLRLSLARQTGNPIEPRGVVARFDRATGQLTVWISTQAAHHVREHLGTALGLPCDRIRVITPDVGGGFGVKEHLYQDEVLVCLAAIKLSVPVKWVQDRRETFLSDSHARDQLVGVTLGIDGDLTFAALDAHVMCNLGAYPTNVGAGPPWVTAAMLEGPYRFGTMHARVQGVVTNKTPLGAYRGFGMQQSAFVRERIVDEAARRIGVDPLDLRRANLVRSSEMPFTTRSGMRYESGDYQRALEEAVGLTAADGAPGSDGRRRGTGYACYVEFTGLGPVAAQQAVNFNLSGYETALVRMEPDGSVTVTSGVSSMGQGVETALAQIVADRLDLPMELVRVDLGDTATAPYSSAGSIASRSLAVGGGAAVEAATRLREKLVAIAAHRLEAAPEDVELEAGSFTVRGVPASAIPLTTVARESWLGWHLPPGMEPGLEVRSVFDPAGISFSYATHVASVAVDPETGQFEIEHYAVVHDCGTRVNPGIVDGQIVGGVAQGIGGAVLEALVHDADGQPLTTTYLDYLLPTAAEIPDVTLGHIETPSPFVPGGMKGAGEGGTIAPPAAIANALAQALPEVADRIVAIPLTPCAVWTLLQEARASAE